MAPYFFRLFSKVSSWFQAFFCGEKRWIFGGHDSGWHFGIAGLSNVFIMSVLQVRTLASSVIDSRWNETRFFYLLSWRSIFFWQIFFASFFHLTREKFSALHVWATSWRCPRERKTSIKSAVAALFRKFDFWVFQYPVASHHNLDIIW